jgi:hypothetical protein
MTEQERLEHYKNLQRQSACFAACKNIPTEVLKSGLLKKLYDVYLAKEKLDNQLKEINKNASNL